MDIFEKKLFNLKTPTAFHELNNLKKELDTSQKIYIKRDDCTEIGLGGNKSRKLEYLLYDAIDKKSDTIITVGGKQSNHCRQTLAYANKLGLETHLILDGVEEENPQGNLFLFGIMGANIHYVEDENETLHYAEKLEKKLINEGKKPYFIPVGASVPIGSVAYIESLKEIKTQSEEIGINIDHIFVATGSAGTQAGLEVGKKLFLKDTKIHGVSVSRKRELQQVLVSDLANNVSEFLKLNLKFKPEEIIVHDEYYGGKYAVPTKKGNEAIKLIAKTEGIILDPVYTGKAMSGLIDLLQKQYFKNNENICFIHTGGSPAIFNFTKSFL